MTDASLPAQGWMPMRAYWRDNQPWLDWVNLGEERLAEPFFDDSIRRCLNKPFNLVFQQQTPLAVLGEWLAREPVPDPAGFIFHMSRCGSTLIAQMLAASYQNIVLSEAPPIDFVLATKYRLPDLRDEQRCRRLQWLIGAMTYRRSPSQRHAFIKFDCWNILDLPLIRRAFPTVPWIFLYREPIEVLMSQVKQRGAYFLPSIIPPTQFGLSPQAAMHMPAHEYCARVLAAVCEAGLRHAALQDGLLVEYRELPQVVPGAILCHSGVDCAGAEVAAMLDVANYDAKTPALFFTPDSEAKRQAATDAAKRAAETWLDPTYRNLNAARSTQSSSGKPFRRTAGTIEAGTP